VASFPTSLPSFPAAATLASQNLSTSPHSTLHGNLGAELLAALTKVGVDSSAVTTTHDYKISKLEQALGVPFYVVVASSITGIPDSTRTFICDGTADQTEIQAALDAASAAGGGIVLLSAGTFTISATDAINIPAEVALFGQGNGANGAGATILNCTSSTAGPVVKIYGTDSTTRTESPAIGMLTIDGNDGAGNQITGLHVKYVESFTIANLSVFDCRGYGVRITGGSNMSSVGVNRLDYCGSNNQTGTSQRAALYVEDDDGSWASDNLIFDGWWLESNEDRAIHIVKDGVLPGTGANNPYRVTFRNCKIEHGAGVRGGNSNDYILVEAATAFTFDSNYVYLGDLQTDSGTNALDSVIKINGVDGVWITNNLLSYTSSQTNKAFTSWIETAGTNNGITITNNEYQHGGSRAPTYGINWGGTDTGVTRPRNNWTQNTAFTTGAENGYPDSTSTLGDHTIATETGTSFTVSADVTLASNTGTVTANLPTAVGRYGRQLVVKKTGSGGTVTLDGNSTETIDGATTYALSAQWESVTIVADGLTGWVIV
jgi:hypothetical protein